jgi:hypothetical protein
MHARMLHRLLVPGLVLLGAAAVSAQTLEIDTIPGRFDFGKMWTFEDAPTEYFSATYGFDASPEWFERVRLSVLRVPGCSASFVSGDGLAATNHHCIRGRLAAVQREGESLLDDGFQAESLEAERRIPGYHTDQLIAIHDVSGEIHGAVDRATTQEARSAAREAAFAAVQDRLRVQHGDVHVEVRALYHGGRYSAYVFRRFHDVRLVMAPELELGFFGGDPDNFTYPRYALDFAFLRVYGDDGRPHRPERWLRWSAEGVSEGSVVFVVGNPGSTSRLLTMAQLELSRDVVTPVTVRAFGDRLSAMRAFHAADPAAGEAMNLRNVMFTLSNSLKAFSGRLNALRTQEIMARKRASEAAFMAAVAADPRLAERYGDVVERIAATQAEKRALANGYGAFRLLGSPTASSATLRRAFSAVELLLAEQAGDRTTADVARRRAAAVPDLPPELDRALLTIRLEEVERYLGPEHEVTRAALGGRTPGEAAAVLLGESALAREGTAGPALASPALSEDPAVRLAAALFPAYVEYARGWDRLSAVEAELNAELGRARFEVYGTSMPPDGTSSPRITDGVVLPYEYNGTLAPIHTTFYGMYDRHQGHGHRPDWSLPARWVRPPAGLDLGTALNFISTADTFGGNSGSPAITPMLEIVGINFDRNIEGLSRDFIYLPEQGRNIMVDVRAVTESLRYVYAAHRLLAELSTGRLTGAGEGATAPPATAAKTTAGAGAGADARN